MVNFFYNLNIYNFRKILIAGYVVGALVLLSASAIAQEETLDDLLTLDLESLVDFEVTVASKKSEKSSDALGVVSVMTVDQIKKYGALTLHDLLSRFPNVYAYGVSNFSGNMVSVRGGVLDSVINPYTLILVNGRTMRDPFRISINSPKYRTFLIESIEMIRDPDSALYGSGAFTGVINVVTKTSLQYVLPINLDWDAQFNMTYNNLKGLNAVNETGREKSESYLGEASLRGSL